MSLYSHEPVIRISVSQRSAPVALALQETLRRCGLEVATLSESHIPEQSSLFEESPLLPGEKHIAIIDSQFLRSHKMMYRAHEWFQSLLQAGNLFLVRQRYPEDDEKNQVFGKISHVLYYMNYWQDRYIELKKRKDLIQRPETDNPLEFQLNRVREIATFITEFMRTLRHQQVMEMEELEAKSLEPLFQFLGRADLFAKFQMQLPSWYREAWSSGQSAGADMPRIQEILEEDAEAITGEEPVIDLEEIPGISLLPREKPEDEGPSSPEQVLEEDSLLNRMIEKWQHKLPEESQSEDRQVAEASEIQPSTEETNPEDLEDDLISIRIEDEFRALEEEASRKNAPIETVTPTPEVLDLDLEEEELLHRRDPADLLAMQELEDARGAFESQDNSQGFRILESALHRFPQNMRLRKALIRKWLEIEPFHPGLPVLIRDGIIQDPGDEELFLLSGDMHGAQHDLEQARADYLKALAIDPEIEGVYGKLASLTERLEPQSIHQIAEYYRLACKEEEGTSVHLLKYATILHEHFGKGKKAIRYLKQILNRQPEHAEAHALLAAIYFETGKRKKALLHYRLAHPELEESPETWETSENKSRAAETPEVKPESPEAVQKPEVKELPVLEQPTRQKVLTVLITGATSGIGRATAQLFAREGHRVIITGRRFHRLDQLQQELAREYQAEVKILPFDIRSRENTEDAIASLEGGWKEIDVLVNNAGLAKGLAPIHEGDIDHWETMIDTNIKGLLYITRAVAPLMVERKQGHIINLGSVAGKEVYPNGSVYCATKFAVDALTRGMRLDLHPYGIKVSQVCPGHVEETEFALVRFDGDAQKADIYKDFQPLRSPDIARIILDLVNQPGHVDIQDVLVFSAQQASATTILRNGRG